MKKIIVRCVLILSFCFLFACNTTISRSAIVDEVETIKDVLTVKEVKKRFGEPNHQLESYLLYQSGPREVWFWFLTTENIPPDDFFIAFITFVYPKNPEMTKIIWPARLKNHDPDFFIKSIESSNQSKAKGTEYK